MTELSRRAWLLVAVTAPLAIPARARAQTDAGVTNGAARRAVHVQPLGTALDANELDLVETALRAFYDIDVVRREPVALPRSAFYAPRQRYRAEKLLDYLESIASPQAHRVLGVTNVDISTTKGSFADWGVLGLAGIDGKTCVLSSFRCRRKAKSPEHARIRFAKTAVHELGHTFGLPHCPNFGCLMEDGRGSVLTTDHEYDLCAESRARLTRAGYALASGAIPWPKP